MWTESLVPGFTGVGVCGTDSDGYHRFVLRSSRRRTGASGHFGDWSGAVPSATVSGVGQSEGPGTGPLSTAVDVDHGNGAASEGTEVGGAGSHPGRQRNETEHCYV